MCHPLLGDSGDSLLTSYVVNWKISVQNEDNVFFNFPKLSNYPMVYHLRLVDEMRQSLPESADKINHRPLSYPAGKMTFIQRWINVGNDHPDVG